MTIAIDDDLTAMGEDLAHAYRVTLLLQVNNPLLTDAQQQASWEQIAQIDRWIGVE